MLPRMNYNAAMKSYVRSKITHFVVMPEDRFNNPAGLLIWTVKSLILRLNIHKNVQGGKHVLV